LQLVPDEVMAYGRRGEVRFDLGRYRKAIDDFTKAMELDYGDLYYERGRCYQLIGDNTRALGDFRKVKQNDHWYDSAHERIAELTATPTNGSTPVSAENPSDSSKLLGLLRKAIFRR
jgi:tetratricopeptide (TPR) repeat protein